MTTATTPFSTFTATTRTLSAAAYIMNTVGSTSLIMQVCDKNAACFTDDFNVVVTPNTAPAPGTLTNQVWARDTVQSYTFPAFTDAEGDAFTYTSLSCTAAGFTFNAATRTVSMTANSVAAGVHTCTITADDTYVNGVNTAGVFLITVYTRPDQNPIPAHTLYKCQTEST